MSLIEKEFKLISGERKNMRKELISEMLDEQPGNGTGEKCSRYQYNVDGFKGYGIYLKRPTRLNKGFDFTVNISGLWFKKNRKYSNPSHQDIFDALEDCKNEFNDKYHNVTKAISEIYNCKDIDLSITNELYFHDFEDNKHPIGIILLAIKWLFMEQDCAYWNYSGRGMFYSALINRNLA